jgi:hypothetical protein
MILNSVARAGLGAARIIGGAASHTLWWVSYRVGGNPRKNPTDPRRRPDR